MNYLDRPGRRRMVSTNDAHTFEVDFSADAPGVDGVNKACPAGRDDSYREMHRALLQGSAREHCSNARGLQVVPIIAAAEQAAKEGQWIER
jgi:predicted dehydrogenase